MCLCAARTHTCLPLECTLIAATVLVCLLAIYRCSVIVSIARQFALVFFWWCQSWRDIGIARADNMAVNETTAMPATQIGCVESHMLNTSNEYLLAEMHTFFGLGMATEVFSECCIFSKRFRWELVLQLCNPVLPFSRRTLYAPRARQI